MRMVNVSLQIRRKKVLSEIQEEKTAGRFLMETLSNFRAEMLFTLLNYK